MDPFPIMPVKFEQADWQQSANNRKAQRNAVQMYAELRLSVGQKFKVSVVDLSQTGFRVETGNHIELGSRVYLAIPELNSLPAQIAWHDSNHYGFRFLNPLHASVFEHIARKYPALIQ